MFTAIRLKNVRCFADDRYEFELKPLTVFCGTNSSGKSTVMKILPFLKQNHMPGAVSTGNSGRVKFSGGQVDLGDYASLVTANDVGRSIEVGIDVDDVIDIAFLESTFNKSEKFREIYKKIRSGRAGNKRDDEYSLKIDLIFGKECVKSGDLADDESSPCRSVVLEANYAIYINGVLLTKWHIKRSEPLKKRYSLRAPYIMFLDRDFYELMSSSKHSFRALLNKKSLVGFGCILTGLFPLMTEAKPVNAKTETRKAIMISLPPIIQGAIDDLTGSLFEIHYIGPLRSPAKRYYVASADSTPDLDASGDFLPYILRDRLDSVVQCCLPENLEKVEKITLGEALNYWLHFLRTGDRKAPAESEFSPTFHKSVLGEISIRGLSSMHGLIDSGFGYSQLLPILVRGLVARGNGTLLVEQPELHLHPSVQIRLADFFAGLCRAGRQVIVETHSEHLVNAFRVLVAESEEGGDLYDVIKIHYIGANEGQRPHCYDLSVQPDGTVPAWPREFFGEALALSSRLLKAQKRRRTTNIIPSNGGGE